MSSAANPTLLGFEVRTMSGEHLGNVVGHSSHSVIVEQRRGPFRSRRAVPSTFTVAQENRRKLIVLVPREAFERSPRLKRTGELRDEEVAFYYQWALRTGS
jgi:hypothetical protein